MKIILAFFFLCSFTNSMCQLQEEPIKPNSFTIADYSISGLSKKHVTIVAYYSNSSYFIHQSIGQETAGVQFYVGLDEKYNLFDLKQEITGATGNTVFGSTTIRYDKTTYIKYKYGFDNEELMNDSYYNYYDENKNRIVFGESETALIKHTELVIQAKVDNQFVKLRINLKNPLFHQFLQNCKAYTVFKKAQEKAGEIAKEEKTKAEELAKEDAKKKAEDAADENFRLNYGYLFNGLQSSKSVSIYTLNKVDSFLVNFNHGKIPVEAIFNIVSDESFMHHPEYPGDIILKTNKEVIFYDWQKIQPLGEIGVLPKGKLIRLKLWVSYIRHIAGKAYVNISLAMYDPWISCIKPKYQGQDLINGLVPLESLEFGNAADIADYRIQVKEYARNGMKGIKKPCAEIMPGK